MTNKILVTGTSVRKGLLQPLMDAGFEVDNPTHLLSEDELKTRLETSVGYILGGDEYASRYSLSEARNLKIIAFLGMGYEGFIDTNAANEFRIPITNTPGTLSNSVAEMTVGLALCGTRKLYSYATNYASGLSGNELKQHDLGALHVGIIGLGGVGTRIAEIIRRGFNSKVSYFSRTRKIDVEEKLDISYLSLQDLCSQVEVLFIMIPGSDQTKGMIGQTQVSTFKEGVILINTARPEIVDPAALLYGFESEKIEYAAYDNFYKDESELVERLKSFIPHKLMVTPHIGSLTHEARDGMAIRAVNSVKNVVLTGDDQFIVNKDSMSNSTK